MFCVSRGYFLENYPYQTVLCVLMASLRKKWLIRGGEIYYVSRHDESRARQGSWGSHVRNVAYMRRFSSLRPAIKHCMAILGTGLELASGRGYRGIVHNTDMGLPFVFNRPQENRRRGKRSKPNQAQLYKNTLVYILLRSVIPEYFEFTLFRMV